MDLGSATLQAIYAQNIGENGRDRNIKRMRKWCVSGVAAAM